MEHAPEFAYVKGEYGLPKELTYENLLNEIHNWAHRTADVRMVLIVGSRARTQHPHDAWSDLDVVVVTTTPEPYLQETRWIEQFARPLLTFLEPTAVGAYTERRVLFEQGLDVDFSIVPVAAFASPWSPDVESVFHRGVFVVADKDGLADHLPQPRAQRTVQIPGHRDLVDLVNEFFYQFMWSAKKLCRGELWAAKMCCDGLLKWQLLHVIEWHTQLTGDSTIDTWHNGRFFDRWVEEAIREEAKTTFANYDQGSVWTALFRTKELFKRLAWDVAATLGVGLSESDIEAVESLVQSYYESAM